MLKQYIPCALVLFFLLIAMNRVEFSQKEGLENKVILSQVSDASDTQVLLFHMSYVQC